MEEEQILQREASLGHYMMNEPPASPPPLFDISITKSTMILLFVVFLLGLFIGRSMNPVIVR
jgi:hypothetical protein